jgi:hypothetical protein
MAVQSENERNKAVVDEYFKAGVQGHLTSFAAYLHPDFTVTAPNYLPWGGRHVGAAGQDRGWPPRRALGRASGRGNRGRNKKRATDFWRPVPSLNFRSMEPKLNNVRLPGEDRRILRRR